MENNLLIIFVRNPVIGKVKTRLARSVGPARALEIYKILMDQTRQITGEVKSDKVVYYSDHNETGDIWEDQEFQKRVQTGKDLGSRMMNAFEEMFSAGYDRIVIIGNDCFDLTTKIVNQAFDNLESSEVVVGPAQDGGYYLLGMKKLHREFFINKSWGTSTVLADTIQDIRDKELHYRLLPQLSDVDEEQDLHILYAALNQF